MILEFWFLGFWNSERGVQGGSPPCRALPPPGLPRTRGKQTQERRTSQVRRSWLTYTG